MDQTPAATPAVTGADLQKRIFLLGDLFRLAWGQFTKNWQSIVILTVIISLPLNLLSAIANSQVTSTNAWGVFTVTSGITAILYALLGILIPMGITVIIRASLEGKQLSYQEALRAAMQRWAAGITTSVLMALCLIGLAILLIVPAIYFGVLWAFAMYVIVDENLSGMAALKSSRATVTGRWWKVLGNTLAFSIVAGIIASVVSMPFGNSSLIAVTISSTIAGIGTSFSLVAGYLLYRNLKANRATNA